MASLKSQLNHAILGCFIPGADKHSAKQPTVAGKLALPDNTPYIYSIEYKDELLALSSQAMTFIKKHHPKIKLLKNITVEHWNEFLTEKARTCSTTTLERYTSNIRKFNRNINHIYRINIDWHSGLRAPTSQVTPDGDLLRIQQMSREDFSAIIKWMTRPAGRSLAYIACELSARFGHRVAGAADAIVEHIHFDKPGRYGFGQVYIREKGGRPRYVDIKSLDDRQFLQKLTEGKSPGDKLVGIKKDSINKQINRAMTALGLKKYYPETSEHSIRKMYAQETWDQARNSGMSRSDAIRYCNEQLGHSATRDVSLLKRYVHNMW